MTLQRFYRNENRLFKAINNCKQILVFISLVNSQRETNDSSIEEKKRTRQIKNALNFVSDTKLNPLMPPKASVLLEGCCHVSPPKHTWITPKRLSYCPCNNIEAMVLADVFFTRGFQPYNEPTTKFLSAVQVLRKKGLELIIKLYVLKAMILT